VDLTIKLAALCELYAVMVMDCLLKGGKNCEKQIRKGSESDVNIGTRRSHSSTSTTRMSGQYILTSG